MTRAFVLVDIEGIAGVVHSQEGDPGNPEYERARRLMTGEANAAVAGVLDADPNAQVTVTDAHGPYRNIIPEELDARARLLRGKPATMGMVDGLGPDYDAALFVGVHGKAGTGSSAICHTFKGTILDVRIDGRSFGELGLNAAVAGSYGVPVVLVAGDQTVSDEAHALLGSAVKTVVVKESRGHFRAESLHPSVACERIRQAAREAVQERSAIVPFQASGPIQVEVEVAWPAIADMVAVVDGVERVDGYTLRAVRPDMVAAYRFLRLVTLLCTVPM